MRRFIYPLISLLASVGLSAQLDPRIQYSTYLSGSKSSCLT